MNRCDWLLVVIGIAFFGMMMSIICTVFGYLKLPEFICWQTALFLSPFFLFSILISIYNILIRDEYNNHHHNE